MQTNEIVHRIFLGFLEKKLSFSMKFEAIIKIQSMFICYESLSTV